MIFSYLNIEYNNLWMQVLIRLDSRIPPNSSLNKHVKSDELTWVILIVEWHCLLMRAESFLVIKHSMFYWSEWKLFSQLHNKRYILCPNWGHQIFGMYSMLSLGYDLIVNLGYYSILDCYYICHQQSTISLTVQYCNAVYCCLQESTPYFCWMQETKCNKA